MNLLGWLFTLQLAAIAVLCGGVWASVLAWSRHQPASAGANAAAIGGGLVAGGFGLVLGGAAGYLAWWPLLAATLLLCLALGALVAVLRVQARARRQRAVVARLRAQAGTPAGRHHAALRPGPPSPPGPPGPPRERGPTHG